MMATLRFPATCRCSAALQRPPWSRALSQCPVSVNKKASWAASHLPVKVQAEDRRECSAPSSSSRFWGNVVGGRLVSGRSTAIAKRSQHQRNLTVSASQTRQAEANFRHDTSALHVSSVEATWTEGFFTANDVHFIYHNTVHDTDLPIFVFLHGLTSAGPVLIPLLSELADEFQIMLPTARGHGASQPMPKGSFTMENLVLDAAAAIRNFAPGQKVLLGGHSMGAATAARVAKCFPDLIKGVVLEDPPWLRMPGEPIVPHHSSPKPFDHSRMLKKMSEEEFQKFLLVQHSGVQGPGSQDDESPAIQGLAVSHPLAFTQTESERAFDADSIEPTFRATDDDINEAVEGITVPVLLQTGGGERAVCPPEVAERVLATWPQGKEYYFFGADHVIHAPPFRAEWLESVRTYLRSLL